MFPTGAGGSRLISREPVLPDIDGIRNAGQQPLGVQDERDIEIAAPEYWKNRRGQPI
jgi:hypothetical protein